MWSFSWLFVLEAVVIVTVNIITIVIFTTTSRLRSQQYFLIVSLAVADLLVGLVSVPLHVQALEADLSIRRSQLFHFLYVILDGFCGTASLFGLAALAIERAHATYFPFKHHTLGKIPYIVGIAGVWASSCIIGFASLYTIAKFVTITISLVFIASAYLLIFVKTSCQATSTHHAMNQSNKKLTKTLGIVTFISLVTWLPYQMVAVYVTVHYHPRTVTFYWLRNAAKFLHFSNSLANFFVYAYRMCEFKTEIMRRIRCRDNNRISTIDALQLQENTGRSAGTVGRTITPTPIPWATPIN